MPCYDPETHEYPKRLAAKVNNLTELLCGVCGVVFCDQLLYESVISPELKEWWVKHQAIDALCADAREKHRRGLALTDTERGYLCRDGSE
jgi:hypothetical protein